MVKPPFHVKALYEYSSPHEDDLGFPSDQVITVTEEEDADWYYGKYEDASGLKREGLFPKNFVKMYEPETPPRPSRLSRSRKDLEPPVLPSEDIKDDRPGVARTPSETPKREEATLAALATATQAPRSLEIPAAAPAMNMATKPTPSVTTKPLPPPVTEKPVIGSFRDRINAFNKPTAPVAPTKPGALGAPATSSFIKKPFIAPPPSKNAYIPPPREPPPQRFYRREEDPEIVNQSSTNTEHEERGGPPQIQASVGDDEDLPKPTSLKERIALLQKQQREQAARHAESAQKKEKPKRPPKKRMESHEVNIDEEDQAGTEVLERADTSETLRKRSIDMPREEVRHAARSATRSHKSREATPLASPTAAHLRDFPSDANDADQSGAGDTEDGEEASTGRDDSDEKPRRKGVAPPHKAQAATPHPTDVGDEEDTADEDDREEEVDPEVKRRMEIRERMAKMSGGMGMAGMFGPPGGISPMVPKKQGSKSSERKASDNSTSAGYPDTPAARAPPVPLVSMPGSQRVRSPEYECDSLEDGKGETEHLRYITKAQDPDEVSDFEDRREEPLPTSRLVERAVPPSTILQNRPLPGLPVREIPSALTVERPKPPSPADSRQIPLVDSAQLIMSPSEGSESDDEMSLPPRSLSLQVPGSDNSRPTTRDGPSPIPSSGPTPSLPSRPLGPQARYSSYEPASAHSEFKEKSPVSPTATTTSGKRSSRVPPIPGSSPIIPPVAQSRAPPNLPPIIPVKKSPTEDSKGYADRPRSRLLEESEEEITEYEGDYDTDMAPGATRKPSLKSHGRVSSLEDDSMTEEGDFHHSGLPSLGPPISVVPRVVPPPPPSLPPRNHRQSSDMPRAPPPPPPPSKEPTYEYHDEKSDPNTHPICTQETPLDHGKFSTEGLKTPIDDDDPEGLYSVSPPRHNTISQQPLEDSLQYDLASLSAPGRAPAPRKSLEAQQTSKISRGSTDGQRISLDQSYIAADIDLGQDSQWWAQPSLPPPVLQHRRDIIYEIEETSTTRRGGKQAVTKTVYILYMDYSQTRISAHFEPREPTSVNFEQQHDSPPPRLRQDQLESAHTKFGLRISEGVNSKKETVVGDGTPQALVEELISALPEALPPVGVRAYGALVYANLANATVQQLDEIRSGDIITFRNAKFQGHKGPMKSKYAFDVGKPDHIGIVVDWDGTKKKVRAWEQGRESKKVRIESFKLSDMRSGEVKVWRVMARNWVGWGQS